MSKREHMEAEDENPSPFVQPVEETDPETTELIALRDEVGLETIETIPLVPDRVRAGEPFAVRVSDLDAFPDQRFEFRFEYNTYMERWVFDATHLDTDTDLFHGRNIATFGRTYSYYPYLMCRFIAPTSRPKPDRIGPRNLGRSVQLAVAPGPAGGSFPASAGLTRAEEDALLGRYASDYPSARDWV